MVNRRGFSDDDRSCWRSCCAKFCSRLKKDLLLLLIVIGCIIGFVIGALVNGPIHRIESPEEKTTTLMLIGFAGELFMNMLKMLILPLIVASLICALASLDANATGRVGRRALIYYMATTLLAVILGIALVSTIKPGSSGSVDGDKKDSEPYRTLDAFLDLVRSCFPKNIVQAAVFKKRTKYASADAKFVNVTNIVNGTNSTDLKQVYPASNTVPAGFKTAEGMNILGLVVFSIVFGAVLGQLGDRGIPLRAFFETLNEVIMKMVTLVLWFSPIGICSLIAAKVAGMDDVLTALNMVGMYMVTIISGLLIHALVVLPAVYLVVTRRNPFRFLVGMRDALVTAFGISSSSATLPVTMRCLEENNKVDPRISKFVLPLGATVNMDGTALYEAVACVFIAQANGINLGIGDLLTTCITATAASIGAAGIPQAGLVTMVIVLQAVNLPVDDIGLILSVDWFLDRIRTTINVLGDSYGAGLVEHLSRDDLMTMDYSAREEGNPLEENTERYTPVGDRYPRVLPSVDKNVKLHSSNRYESDPALRETNF